MSDSVFVYAPETGEPFECSKINARDLVTHAGWSYTNPHAEAEAAPPPPPPPPAPEPKPEAKPEAKPEPKPEAKAEPAKAVIEEVAAPAKAKKADAAE